MVQNFKKKYPHIKLRFESAVYDHVTSIFINKSLAGDPPDITFLPNGPSTGSPGRATCIPWTDSPLIGKTTTSIFSGKT